MIVQLLQDICNYYNIARRVGHTQAAIHGVKNTTDAALVVANYSHLCRLRETVSCVILQPNTFIGTNYKSPYVFDNYAIYTLCTEALNEIYRLQRQVDKLQHQVSQLKNN